MKEKILLLLFLCLSFLGYNQQFSGSVLDYSNNKLAGAVIAEFDNPSNAVISDKNGVFKIQIKNRPKVKISFMGYIALTVILKQDQNLIRLTQENVNLDEVLIISGNREIQRRSEIPAAIATIDAVKIEETRAISLDQLLNQVSGVVMSTSRAASNEQHFMSVRSPISTKALFLYLEDGLQIRPTSVFNHNALLEMNDISFAKVEVLKGPASSIYGSEAIGGSFNFITKNPLDTLGGRLGYQKNDLGLNRYELEISNKTSKEFGFYLGTTYSERTNGPVAHSDYEKFALTLKTVYDINSSLKWTSVFDIIKYRSDMTGALSEEDYLNGNYESDQTFTERDALAFRIRTTFDKYWSAHLKTSLNFIFRDNRMDQNPSYRIRQFRDNGALTGLGSGEINSNRYNSYVALLQHKYDFANSTQSSIIVGATMDYSPQRYISETTSVNVDIASGTNIDFEINEGNYILNYKTDIYNYAGFFQYEISPVENLKLTAALRYDGFTYNYENLIQSDLPDISTKDYYYNWAPKIGANFNISNQTGLYANYSKGFTPPQTSTLYQSRNELRGIEPSTYNNFEIGGYSTFINNIKIDWALYVLDGKNTLITLRDDSDNFYSTNAGKTRSYGVEYGIRWNPIQGLYVNHNGSYAKHRYINFFENGINYSATDRETAPKLIGNSNITYKNTLKKQLNYTLSMEYEMVGKYNTSFENQIKNEDETTATLTYDGHHIFNLRASIAYKNLELWTHLLNLADDLYAVRASYNRFRGENNYTIGNPRAFHFGIRYNF